MRMLSYETLTRRAVPFVQPCPAVVVLDAVQMVAVDFFRRTEAWRATFAETLFRGDRLVELAPEREASVCRLLELTLDGLPLVDGEDFRAEQAGAGLCVAFRNPADSDRAVRARCVLAPRRLSERAPEVFLEEYGDTLLFGVLAKIKSMSGRHVGWSDPQAAQMNLSLYEQGVAQARIRLARRADGRRLTACPRNRGDL